ncbi:hypothetical protein GGI20_004692 [Coemansia sp. BCRC 34301]|nr:hypothetical protein GGI20_004692 [Coemansia sp. BCRC 34301]
MSGKSAFRAFKQRVLQSQSTTRVVSQAPEPTKKRRGARNIKLLAGLDKGLRTKDIGKTWYLYNRLLQRDVHADDSVFGNKQPVMARRLVNTAHTHLQMVHSKILEALQPKYTHGYSQGDIDRVGERARLVVEKMGQSGVELTSEDVEHLINCFVRNSEVVDQIWQFATLSGVVRDIGSFNSYLNAKMECRQYEHAFGVMEEIQQAGLQPSEYTYTRLIRLYGLTGDLAVARRTFDDMVLSSKCSVYVYNAMLDVLGMNGLVEEMRQMFLRMTGLSEFGSRDLSELTAQSKGMGLVEPNRATFHVLIKWHARYWDMDTATKYVRVMKQVFGVQPVAKTFKLMITTKTAVREFQKCAEVGVMMKEVYGIVPPEYIVRTLEQAERQLADMESKIKESETQKSSLFSSILDKLNLE